MRGSTIEQNNRHHNCKRVLPPCPTIFLPGSEEKMLVMEDRLEAGYHLHHPQDASYVELDLDVPLRLLTSRSPDQPRVMKMGEQLPLSRKGDS